MNEYLIYVLTALIALSTGIAFGAASAINTVRVLSTIAGILSAAAVVIAAVVLGGTAPWTAPLFAVLSSATALLVSAATRASEPGLLGEGYWRRVTLIAFHSGRLREIEGH